MQLVKLSIPKVETHELIEGGLIALLIIAGALTVMSNPMAGGTMLLVGVPLAVIQLYELGVIRI